MSRDMLITKGIALLAGKQKIKSFNAVELSIVIKRGMVKILVKIYLFTNAFLIVNQKLNVNRRVIK